MDIFKPLSIVLSSAINKSLQHQEENSWERQESNLGLLGEKKVCYLCAMQSPQDSLFCISVQSMSATCLYEINPLIILQPYVQ